MAHDCKKSLALALVIFGDLWLLSLPLLANQLPQTILIGVGVRSIGTLVHEARCLGWVRCAAFTQCTQRLIYEWPVAWMAQLPRFSGIDQLIDLLS